MFVEKAAPLAERDLEAIRADGVLKAITIYSATTYFLYRAQPMGYEYELLKRLADHLELELEIVIAKNINQLFDMLNQGEGDLVAHGMTITASRKQQVDFTEYLYLTRQVLVQKKPEGWRTMQLHEIQAALVSDPIALIGDTVSVRNNSSYHHRLKNLMEEIGGPIHIDTVPGSLSTDEIIEKVVNGDIKFTVADNNIAAIHSTYYDDLDIHTDISFSQQIAWAVRKNSPGLLDAVNEWIRKMKWAGAKGLMQMMTPTAREMGASNPLDPEENIQAGTKYLHQLWEQWEGIPDSVQRIKFTLASYNCGYYHVVDAQNLAKKRGKDHQIWDNNVEDMILKLAYPQYYQDEVVAYGYVRGREPYAFVEEIFNLFEHYKKFVPA